MIRYGLPKSGTAFLHKPFSAQRLIHKVRDMLDLEEADKQKGQPVIG
jgi:FixJ family two-component response regulator